MSSINIALKRYLERHIEHGLPNATGKAGRWKYVLVIPAYNEAPQLLQTLSLLNADGPVLVILVLNRPDSNPDKKINSALRSAIDKLERCDNNANETGTLYHLNDSTELFCYDMERLKGPAPSAQGVGLARKIGCDIALLWQSQGAISSEWICCTDADATLPADYFSRLERAENFVAAVYPFVHTPCSSNDINRATLLYELRLHQYVLGLAYARSPYAYHTLGSCIAVKCLHYAQVRGYPKRSGGEDFYLLNKLAKVGSIASLSGECISLQSRTSNRVTFGTGPAVQKIIEDNKYQDSALFYHPQCFEMLKALLTAAPQLREYDLGELPKLLQHQGISEELAQTVTNTLLTIGLATAISHCQKHGKTQEKFLRQFHQWFDGFKTLKFIHGIRDEALPMQNLNSALKSQPILFPTGMSYKNDLEALRAATTQQWQWTMRAEMSVQHQPLINSPVKG